jgi:HAD superfamily hydrolase (TIGR01450 family)
LIYKNLEEVYERYDSFLVDVYGVLYDGNEFYKGALDTLEMVKGSGRRIVILSNTSTPADICKPYYAKRGLSDEIHYDEFISSGEAFKRTVSQHLPDAKTYFQIFRRNESIFAESKLVEAKGIEAADLIYVGVLNRFYAADELRTKGGLKLEMDAISSVDCHDIKGFDEVADMLDTCLKFNKTLVVINPDIFAMEAFEKDGVITKRPMVCQGAVGEFYEKMGGKVLYFGKPYQAIYDFAKQFIKDSKKTAMIGDTPWTDILGGNMAGVDTILTLTGISGEFFKLMEHESLEKKLKQLLEGISLKMTHKSLANISQEPTIVIKSLACSIDMPPN